MEDEKDKKKYQKPEIKHELELEIRAGSPCIPDPLDIFNPLGKPPC